MGVFSKRHLSYHPNELSYLDTFNLCCIHQNARATYPVYTEGWQENQIRNINSRHNSYNQATNKEVFPEIQDSLMKAWKQWTHFINAYKNVFTNITVSLSLHHVINNNIQSFECIFLFLVISTLAHKNTPYRFKL